MKRLIPLVLVGMICFVPARAQTPDDKKATLVYVQKLQQPDAGFTATLADAKTAGKSSLRATSTALRVFKYWGGEPTDRAAIAKFVAAHFDKTTGGFVDAPGGKPDVFTTAVGLMAVVELKMPTEPYVAPAIRFLSDHAQTFEEIRIAAAGFEAIQKPAPKADAWIAQIVKIRNPDGTYGKGSGLARDTGGAVAALLRLGAKIDMQANVVKALKAGQRADGGFGKEDAPGSDLETTYRVMRTFMMLKEKPDDARVRAFIASCRNADGGYGVAPGQPSSVSGSYFAGIITHWLSN